MSDLKTLLQDRRAATGLLILTVLCAIGVLAPFIAPADPVVQHDVLRTLKRGEQFRQKGFPTALMNIGGINNHHAPLF